MALFVSLLLLVLFTLRNTNAVGPPSPAYFPGSRIPTIGFDQGYRTLWGAQHQTHDKGGLTMWLDKSSGSGFKSLAPYASGYFSAGMKLQANYTAGVITCFYLSNSQVYSGAHDEIDFEFLGTIIGEPYVLQTNVYMLGSGSGNTVGREVRFNLWFDPTLDFHNYTIIWNPNEIVFLVDDVPIRMYSKKSDATFPSRPMWGYGSIWDASDWATDGGKYKIDYKYQPFIGRYNNFKISGCNPNQTDACCPASASPSGGPGLSSQQYAAMAWVKKNYNVYDYCENPRRDPQRTPECNERSAWRTPLHGPLSASLTQTRPTTTKVKNLEGITIGNITNNIRY